jgi:3-methyladenine DNA glycosylase AlkD
MNTAQVMALLEANRNERGIRNWQRIGAQTGTLKSFGIGLTVLRKLAKQIGRDHALALELWNSDLYDAKTIGLLIDDPKEITREQAEAQVDQLQEGLLAHVFSSCDAALAKTAFVVELASDWMSSRDVERRCCGYGLLYELSKSTKKSAPDDAFFLERIRHIARSFGNEPRRVQGSMGGALVGMGKRNARLNTAALKVARAIGPIHFGADDSSSEPLNVVKHLTSDYITKKLAV